MRPVPSSTVVLVLVTALLGLVSAGMPAFTTSDLTTGTGELRLYLDVLEENNLPTWWATAVLVVAAATAAFVAHLTRLADERGWWRWGVLAGLFALLSLDEMTSLHERLDRLVVDRVDLGSYPFLWVVPGGALALVLVVVVTLLLRALAVRPRRWLVLGLGLLVGSALGGELIQGLLLGTGDVGPRYVLAYHAEEFGETVGGVFLLTGAATAFHRTITPAGGLLLGLATPHRVGAPPIAAVSADRHPRRGGSADASHDEPSRTE